MVDQSHSADLDKALRNDKSDVRRSDDRREFVRRHIDLPIRFLTPDGVEHAGKLYDLSEGGMRIISPTVPFHAELLIVYIDNIGRFEGKIIPTEENGFVVQMDLSSAKIIRMQNSINSYFSRHAKNAPVSTRRKGTPERRAHRRAVCDSQREITGITADGEKFRCNIVNMSLGGIDISTAATLDLGKKVKIGTAKGRVSRKTTIGYAVVRV